MKIGNLTASQAQHINKASLGQASRSELAQVNATEFHQQERFDQSVLALKGENYLEMRGVATQDLAGLEKSAQRLSRLTHDEGDLLLLGAGGGACLAALTLAPLAAIGSKTAGDVVGSVILGGLVGGVVGSLGGLAVAAVVQGGSKIIAQNLRSETLAKEDQLERLDQLAQQVASSPQLLQGDRQQLVEQMLDQEINSQLAALPQGKLESLNLRQLSQLAHNQAKQAIEGVP